MEDGCRSKTTSKEKLGSCTPSPSLPFSSFPFPSLPARGACPSTGRAVAPPALLTLLLHRPHRGGLNPASVVSHSSEGVKPRQLSARCRVTQAHLWPIPGQERAAGCQLYFCVGFLPEENQPISSSVAQPVRNRAEARIWMSDLVDLAALISC